MTKSKLNPGDRVAYAAKFLKDTGQFTGNAGERRGTYLRPAPGMPKYGYVRWDDEAERIASGQGDYAEADYCKQVRRNGSLVCLPNITRVGSVRFALNDL
jgi:hypothetical protein